MGYKEYSECPKYVIAKYSGPDTTPKGLKWSGEDKIPLIGARVKVGSNSIGWAKVIAYFSEGGWLGIKVLPENPPEWYEKQNGKNVPCHIYGTELGPQS